MATETPKPDQAPIGSGAVRQAVTAIKSRKSRLDEAEDAAVNGDKKYAKGGTVAPSPAAIRSYSREYDIQSPAGRNVHEDNRTTRRYAAGGMVSTKQTRGFGKARRGA